MDVEQLKVLKTLQVGEKVWRKDTILSAPFSKAIEQEIRAHLTNPLKYDTIKILRRKGDAPPPAAVAPITPTVALGEEKQPEPTPAKKAPVRRKK